MAQTKAWISRYCGHATSCTATLLVILLLSGCSDESPREEAAHLPASCELASTAPLSPAGDATSDAPVVASASNFIAMSGYVTVPLLTLHADGGLVVLRRDRRVAASATVQNLSPLRLDQLREATSA